jgi:transcription initiation factor IIF auxiliary subunit
VERSLEEEQRLARERDEFIKQMGVQSFLHDLDFNVEQERIEVQLAAEQDNAAQREREEAERKAQEDAERERHNQEEKARKEAAEELERQRAEAARLEAERAAFVAQMQQMQNERSRFF